MTRLLGAILLAATLSSVARAQTPPFSILLDIYPGATPQEMTSLYVYRALVDKQWTIQLLVSCDATRCGAPMMTFLSGTHTVSLQVACKSTLTVWGASTPDLTWTVGQPLPAALVMPTPPNNPCKVGTPPPPPPPTNTPPVVSVTMPTNGAVFQGIDTFQLAASAIDPGGSVVRVEFRVNGNAVGADATTPYTGSWRPSVTGSYTITAVATDNGGATTTSTPVQISVGPPPPPPNQPPSVSLTSPSNGSVLAAPAPLVLRATANDSDGSVTRVEFLLGTVIVGSDESEPYEVPWSQSTPGSYTFVARARDNAGAETSSVPATVTVVNPPTEVCGDGLDNDKDGQVDEGCPPPVPQAPVVSGGVSECRFVLSAGATGRTPPDSSGGWWAQFRVNGSIAGIDIDKAVPWQRTIRKAPGTYTWDIVWTKSGWTAAQARVSGATQTLVCGG